MFFLAHLVSHLCEFYENLTRKKFHITSTFNQDENLIRSICYGNKLMLMTDDVERKTVVYLNIDQNILRREVYKVKVESAIHGTSNILKSIEEN